MNHHVLVTICTDQDGSRKILYKIRAPPSLKKIINVKLKQNWYSRVRLWSDQSLLSRGSLEKLQGGSGVFKWVIR